MISYKIEGYTKTCMAYHKTPQNAVTCCSGMSRILFPLALNYLSVPAKPSCDQRYC